MQLEIVNDREFHIIYVALAFLKRCKMDSEALKVDLQLTENAMDYRQILDKEIDNILERLGVSY